MLIWGSNEEGGRFVGLGEVASVRGAVGRGSSFRVLASPPCLPVFPCTPACTPACLHLACLPLSLHAHRV